MTNQITFNKPYLTGNELKYISHAAQENLMLAGDGPYTEKCHKKLEEITHSPKVLLTHSCTAALEMAAILLDIQPGDEVIMPSYTFVSTANAFVLRGGVPVFVDIRSDTFNIDETLIESAITLKTRAIVPVHYAGVACEMDTILDIAKRHDLKVVEDAAQGIMSTYKGRPLGSMGTFGCLSFHETKNIISGEGGALLINDPKYFQRAEIIREKGTDRSQFFRGEVDKYTWQKAGSSFLPGELTAAFLWAQLEEAETITKTRINAWENYHKKLECFEENNSFRRPILCSHSQHNGHMYPIVFNDNSIRNEALKSLNRNGIGAVFHYIPLHSSPAGLRHGRTYGKLTITDRVSECLLRLPMYVELDIIHQEKISKNLDTILSKYRQINSI
jgi:dTDP-4-amino-4,6-dideoxygalactose transaminase